MKIKKLLISACLLLGMNSLSFGQINLLANWAGPGGTGPGAPNEYGWEVLAADGSPGTAVVWQAANTGGTRYVDVTPSSNPVHTLNGSPYTGRLLLLRWDASGGTSLGYVYNYPVTLAANQQYRFSWIYEWWNNATAPTYTVGISRDKLGTDKVASKEFVTETRNVLNRDNFTFTAPSAGTYYITVQASTATLSGVGEMSLVAINSTGVRNELSGNSGYAMYPNPASRENGLYLAERASSNESVQLYIYSSAGKLQKQVKVNASDSGRIDISDLSAGLYIAKVVTKKGTFNKTIVVQ